MNDGDKSVFHAPRILIGLCVIGLCGLFVLYAILRTDPASATRSKPPTITQEVGIDQRPIAVPEKGFFRFRILPRMPRAQLRYLA